MKIIFCNKWLLVLLVSFCTLSVVIADDTEIYFGNSTSSVSTIHPNILLVLDTSSSMTSEVSGTGMSRLDNMKGALRTLISNTNNVNMGLMRFSRAGGPVLYPITYIDQALETAAAGQISSRVSTSQDDALQHPSSVVELDSPLVSMTEVSLGNTLVELEIATDADDAEERVSNQSLDTGSSDLEIMSDRSNEQMIGLRFNNSSAINASSSIISAVIEFSDDSDSGTNSSDLEVVIQAELGGDSGTFTHSQKVSDRSLTTASSNWSVGIFNASGKLSSSDLAGVITEVITDSGWNAGDPLTFILRYTSGNGRRVAMSRDKTSSSQPKLKITYSTGAGGTENQTVGLRFQSIAVPKGATITSASLEFVAAQASADTTNLLITAESTGNAPEFTSTSNDLSVGSRPRTSASVAWAPSHWPTIGDVIESADISAIIQEVVDHSDWCGNNAMAIFISGLGKRIAESFDGDPSSAPLLKINYDPDSAPASTCFNKEFSYRVQNSTDDGEEKSGADVYLDSSDLELVEDGSVQEVGIRFNAVQIPNSAEIQSAYLEFTAKDATSDSTSITIYGHDTDNSSTFGATSNKISSRTKTVAATSWPNIGSWNAGVTYRSPDITAIVQGIVNRGGWAAGNGLSFIINGSGKRRAYSYNGSAGEAPRLVVQVKSDNASLAIKTVRDELLEIVDGIQYKSGTPIVGAYYEAALYFRGEDVDFGKQRGNSGSSRREHTRVSHSDAYTGGSLNRDAACTDDNLSSTSCISENISGNASYISPINNVCQKNHIVILTDGSASYNDAEAKVKSLTGENSCINSGNQACGPELATWLNNTDQAQSSLLPGNQTITTHSIGFNFTGDWIKSISSNGGGGFYEASTADQLVGAFESIVTQALKSNSTFVSPAAAINQFNRLNHLNNIFFAVFKPSDEAMWDGNVKKYQLSGTENDITDASGNLAIDDTTGFFKDSSHSFWSSSVDGPNVAQGGAAEHLPEYDDPRLTYTYTSTSADLTDASNAVHPISSSYNIAITKTMLGDASMLDAEREDLLDWISGKDVLDEDNDASTTDSRQSMADPLHSKPVVFTHSGTSVSPNLALLFGTNDGKFRAVDVSDGKQLWSFIPPELLPVSTSLYDNASSTAHPYGVDGAPLLWVNDPDFDGISIDLSGTDNFAYVYFGLRRGGRNYYALDVTDISSPQLLWKIEGGAGDFVELGQSWSRPVRAKITIDIDSVITEKDVLIFTGGYDDDQDNVSERTADDQGRALFIVDAKTGSLIWSGGPSDSFDTTFTDMQYSMPASPAVADLNSDGLADQIYVADVGGQVWRFDILNGEERDSLVTGGVVADLALDSSPVNTRRFYHTPDLALLKDNAGNTVLSVFIGSGYHAHPLDEVVSDRFYRLDMTDAYEPPSSYSALTETDLYDASSNELGSDDLVLQLAAQTAFDTKNGWYITLPNNGEKVLSTPLTIEGQVVFTTYDPEANSSGCSVQPGTSREYVVKASNATPTVDMDSDDAINTGDRSRVLITGSIVDEPVVVITKEGGASTFIGTEKGSINIGAADRVIKTFWYQE
jgi:type IV pilus assembly protein PilY1